MKKTILALGTMLAPEMKEIEKDFNLLRLWKEDDPEAALRQHKNDIVGILSLAGKMAVSRRMIENLPNLELVAQFGVGVDNIDLTAAAERHITVTNTPDLVTADTADIALALILAGLRRIVEADVSLRAGNWERLYGASLTGKTVGILGLGKIGKAIARRCEAFDMKIVYHGRHAQKDAAYSYYADLPQMAEACDILVASCPGGAATRYLINRKILKALGPEGFLVNIARGSVVNTEDLLVSLNNREIAGAGLDVYENEPEVPDALKSMDNVVLLPHIGTATFETRTAMGQLVIANIRAHFDGKPVLTQVFSQTEAG